ncbi:TIGR04222 domain-containing membrane protein [Actinoplanes sp. RD1]|uniref:TIGR04222 domain-containing membrane protein n=1 Tax=Actinoplanes sp. RD1 TaxID=3064538 RepID=UPI0027407A90|nr:TIGR04222 domain-containing membrane protein [Actinoplanes sp. RD1]
MTDTWGISGPAFLALFFAAVVAVLVAAAVHRRILFRGDRSTSIGSLGPQQIAYLNGGDRLAVYAALSGLRSAGAVTAVSGRRLAQSGPLPAGVTPLDTAIHHAAGNHERARDLLTDQHVRSALDQLRAGLERQGLAVSADTIRTARLWALPMLALLVIGIARFAAGVANGKPVGFLVTALVIAACATVFLGRRTGRATGAATRGMTAVRRQHDYLAPSHSPSYATYGASGAAMGVALFGAASLYAMDPAFAAEAEIQRNATASGTGGDSGSYGGGDSGGSSCGGGGCGGGGCGG